MFEKLLTVIRSRSWGKESCDCYTKWNTIGHIKNFGIILSNGKPLESLKQVSDVISSMFWKELSKKFTLATVSGMNIGEQKCKEEASVIKRLFL